jgi:flagellar protein FlgJ
MTLNSTVSVPDKTSLFSPSQAAEDAVIKRLKDAAPDTTGGFGKLLEKEAGNSAGGKITAGNFAAGTDATGTDAAARRPPFVDRESELYKQCEELETLLVKNLLNSMRSTIQKSGLIDEGFAGKMYEDMLYDEYAKDFTKNAGFGLAELAYLELSGRRGKIAL